MTTTTEEIMSVLDNNENNENINENVNKYESTIYDNADLLKISDITDITATDASSVTTHVKKIAKYKPIKTRKNMSKYELASTITKLANYLSTLDSLEQYVETTNINEFVNNAELAFHLLTEGKFDAVINRLGYEQVNFSQLSINPIWVETLENYFKRNREALRKYCYEPYDAALATL